MSRTLVVLVWYLCIGGGAGYYSIYETFNPSNFFDNFDFFTADDPTHGFVDYVEKEEALSRGLISSKDTSAYIGVDYHNKSSTDGRQSVRLATKKAYTEMLVVLDLQHMPGEACGSWPAFWTVGRDWPINGEIDIIEGVNRQPVNRMALHADRECVINTQGYTGTTITSNCFVSALGQPTNAGCGIEGSNGSFGAQFNRLQGGVYAVEWGKEDVKIWFFTRACIPSEIINNSQLDPQSWGIPTARFSGDCSVPSTLGPQRLVFDVTFCGDWAGSDWPQSDCKNLSSKCSDYVANEPQAFQEEYWEIKSLRVFAAVTSTSTTAPKASAPTPYA